MKLWVSILALWNKLNRQMQNKQKKKENKEGAMQAAKEKNSYSIYPDI